MVEHIQRGDRRVYPVVEVSEPEHGIVVLFGERMQAGRYFGVGSGGPAVVRLCGGTQFSIHVKHIKA